MHASLSAYIDWSGFRNKKSMKLLPYMQQSLDVNFETIAPNSKDGHLIVVKSRHKRLIYCTWKVGHEPTFLFYKTDYQSLINSRGIF